MAQQVVPVRRDVDLVDDLVAGVAAGGGGGFVAEKLGVHLLLRGDLIELDPELEAQLVELLLGVRLAQRGEEPVAVQVHGRLAARARLGRRRSRAEPKSGEGRASVSARAGPRVRRRRAHARILQPAHVSSADCVSRLDRAPMSPDPRFGRADAVADRKRATDGGRCDRRTTPRASRGVSAGVSGRRDASPRRGTYHDNCATTMSRSRRTARVSCAAHVCAGATHHARLE